MHDIWNPWHGCVKCSEGCQNCYMYFLDRMRGHDGADIYKTKTKFDYPLKKDRKGNYKIKSGELIRVCMTSDFFLEEADAWRDDAWAMMRKRRDVKFFILTKRPERVSQCLPNDWGEGWDHIFFNVSVENQRRADERIPILLELPFKHKGIMAAPLLGAIEIEHYLKSNSQIEQVICEGENYDGARHCHFNWIKSLRNQCEKYQVTFCFTGTGNYFIKDDRTYYLPKRQVQSEMAFKSGMSYIGNPMKFRLVDEFENEIPEKDLYEPRYGSKCQRCASRMICNGCSDNEGC